MKQVKRARRSRAGTAEDSVANPVCPPAPCRGSRQQRIADGRRPEASRSLRRIRVGIDLVSVREVARTLKRFGERYVRRVFTAREGAYCRAAAGTVAATRFAARFAAKEAALKALRPDEPWADWRAIEVLRHASGWCEILLHGEAAKLAGRRGVEALTLSMTHDVGYATAVVVAETLEPACEREP